MSGIYIPNMEMPKDATDCEFSNEFFTCSLTKERCALERMGIGCPLVLVPDHGRLIDADALKERLKTAMPTYPLSGCRTYADTNILWYINNAPTIVPAEEAET